MGSKEGESHRLLVSGMPVTRQLSTDHVFDDRQGCLSGVFPGLMSFARWSGFLLHGVQG